VTIILFALKLMKQFAIWCVLFIFNSPKVKWFYPG